MESDTPLVGYEVMDDVAVLTLDAPPVNALSAALRQGLVARLSQAEGEAAVLAIVLIGAGRGFSAGADITEFSRPAQSPTLRDVLEAVEGSTKPVVAALHGATLGGGFELAMAAHARVMAPSGEVGLPEVKLGLVPGSGGTQRLPRLVGPQMALEMIASGDRIGAEAARATGVVDEVSEEGGLREAAIALALRLAAEGRPPRKVRDLEDKIASAHGDRDLFDTFRQANARRFRGFEAPQACIQAVQAAVDLPFAEGLARERELFLSLVSGPQSGAQRYAFFAERRAAKVDDVPDDTPLLPIRKVGIIGAGTMGGGIAMNFLNAGLAVAMVETRAEALERGQQTIRRNYEATAKRGRMSSGDVETRMGLLQGGLDFDALADCDLVIEAVFEDMEVKKQVFARLDGVARPGAILATNTSYLNVDEIAAATSRPQDVIGLHFFSPANVMRLLEIVRGVKTSKSVIATSMQLAKRIGKVAVLVGVSHGFVGNRMLAQRQREAGKLILEGAMPWDVDRVLYDFGMPMGPFAMADLAGLDLGWSRERSVGGSVRDLLCEMDRRGQKNGAGFYDYDPSRKATPSPVVETVIHDFAARQGIAQRAISDDEILARCLYPVINEGAKILEEKIASRASDIDVVWLNGYGWPLYRGGPMYYADTIGLGRVLEQLQAFQERFGDDFKPAPLLERVVTENGKLHDL